MKEEKNVRNDIMCEDDIAILVTAFYDKVRQDRILAPVFDQIIKDNWDLHLKKMTDFWSTILLYTRKYHGDPLPKHLPLPVDSLHFDRWLLLFNETIDELFQGQIADNAGKRANSIARIMRAVKNVNP